MQNKTSKTKRENQQMFKIKEDLNKKKNPKFYVLDVENVRSRGYIQRLTHKDFPEMKISMTLQIF